MRRINNDLYNFLIHNDIANTPQFNDANILQWGNQNQNVIQHYNSYLANIQVGGESGPIEKHPYFDNHADDFDLSRKFLVLGTFPPSSYFNNLDLAGLPNPNIQNNNPFNYYYGNTADFWVFLFGEIPEDIDDLKHQLLQNGVSISDVFKYIQRKKMNNAADNNLYNIVLNCDVKRIFSNDSKISTLLFTSGNLSKLLNNQPSALAGFRWILEDCMGGLLNFEISGSFNGDGPYYPINNEGLNNAEIQQNGGIVWWLKNKDKKIRIINLPSPSRNSFRQDPRTSFYFKYIHYMALLYNVPPPQNNQNLRNYTDQHFQIFTNTPSLKYRNVVYQKVLNDTLNEIL
jgi:hypothetical protein